MKSATSYDYDSSVMASELPDMSLEESLFTADQERISNEDLARVLSGTITLPQSARLAVLPLSRGYARTGNALYFEMEPEAVESALNALRQSRRLSSAAFLPSLLAPERPTISLVREAAARYQSDLVLIYRVDDETYSRYRVFHRDETKAYITVEAILLDVRSGIVPFSTMAVETSQQTEKKSDMSSYETVRRAQREATGRAMLKVAQDLVRFLDALPQ